MEALLTLLILLFVVFMPLLPAIITFLMRRAVGRREQEPQTHSAPERVFWLPPEQAIAVRPEHFREDVAESAISLETIPERPTSLDEVPPRLDVSLEEEGLLPLPESTTVAEVRARQRRAFVRGPFDVRRGIVVAAVLGPPRADDPYRG